jgi:predicted  nucleic acid-binding Zn-ribbon protein
MTMREDYEKRLQAQLADWKVELDKLWAKTKDAQADAAKEMHRQIDKLKAQRETLEKDLAKMRKAGEGSWKDLRAGSEQAWKSMEQAISAAWSRFR